MSFESFLGELRANSEARAKVAPPPGAVDCAVAVTGLDGAPAPEGLTEHPPEAYRAMQEVLGLSRLVLLQPDEPGFDIEMLLQARAALATSPDDLVEDCTRAFATLAPGEDPARLADLADAGIDGLSLSMLRGHETCRWEDLDRHVRRTHDITGWNREIVLDGSDLHELEKTIRDWPGETVLAECGGFRFSRSVTQPGFRSLRRLIDRGHVWVKLSRPERLSIKGVPEDPEVAELVRALIDWAPERMLWGSGWPDLPDEHSGEAEDPERAGARAALDRLAEWGASPESLTRILLRNPEELYGFPAWPLAPEA